jgi:hypothetical protein
MAAGVLWIFISIELFNLVHAIDFRIGYSSKRQRIACWSKVRNTRIGPSYYVLSSSHIAQLAKQCGR